MYSLSNRHLSWDILPVNYTQYVEWKSHEIKQGDTHSGTLK